MTVGSDLSNLNNGITEPRIVQDHFAPPYDLFSTFNLFPMLDNSLIHNSEGTAPAPFQSNSPETNDRTCDNDKTDSKSASAKNTYSAAVNRSLFSDQNKQKMPMDVSFKGDIFIFVSLN